MNRYLRFKSKQRTSLTDPNSNRNVTHHSNNDDKNFQPTQSSSKQQFLHEKLPSDDVADGKLSSNTISEQNAEILKTMQKLYENVDEQLSSTKKLSLDHVADEKLSSNTISEQNAEILKTMQKLYENVDEQLSSTKKLSSDDVADKKLSSNTIFEQNAGILKTTQKLYENVDEQLSSGTYCKQSAAILEKMQNLYINVEDDELPPEKEQIDENILEDSKTEEENIPVLESQHIFKDLLGPETEIHNNGMILLTSTFSIPTTEQAKNVFTYLKSDNNIHWFDKYNPEFEFDINQIYPFKCYSKSMEKNDVYGTWELTDLSFNESIYCETYKQSGTDTYFCKKYVFKQPLETPVFVVYGEHDDFSSSSADSKIIKPYICEVPYELQKEQIYKIQQIMESSVYNSIETNLDNGCLAFGSILTFLKDEEMQDDKPYVLNDYEEPILREEFKSNEWNQKLYYTEGVDSQFEQLYIHQITIKSDVLGKTLKICQYFPTVTPLHQQKFIQDSAVKKIASSEKAVARNIIDLYKTCSNQKDFERLPFKNLDCFQKYYNSEVFKHEQINQLNLNYELKQEMIKFIDNHNHLLQNHLLQPEQLKSCSEWSSTQWLILNQRRVDFKPINCFVWATEDQLQNAIAETINMEKENAGSSSYTSKFSVVDYGNKYYISKKFNITKIDEYGVTHYKNHPFYVVTSFKTLNGKYGFIHYEADLYS